MGAIWCFDGPGSGRFVLVFSDGVVTTVLLAWGIVGPSVAWWAAGWGRWRACLRSPNRPLGGIVTVCMVAAVRRSLARGSRCRWWRPEDPLCPVWQLR